MEGEQANCPVEPGCVNTGTNGERTQNLRFQHKNKEISLFYVPECVSGSSSYLSVCNKPLPNLVA